jgi:hypothetical protein
MCIGGLALAKESAVKHAESDWVGLSLLELLAPTASLTFSPGVGDSAAPQTDNPKSKGEGSATYHSREKRDADDSGRGLADQ